MSKKMIDYKGKYFMLQDTVDTDSEWGWMDIEIGEMDDKDITDEFLKVHIENCIYYGIPSYIGEDKELINRIDKFEKEYWNNINKNEK